MGRRNALTSENGSVLKNYYAKYLSDVRKLSKSSVNHYLDALNNISKRLKDMGLVKKDIYEITSLVELANVRDILFADSDFIRLNTDGHNMYSNGLKHYYNFASGEEFGKYRDSMKALDLPVEVEPQVEVKQQVWKRSNILRVQAIELAEYKCEIDGRHRSFLSGTTLKPYMEGHHAIPMNNQGDFLVSLDVYANIVCLCPLCHKKIHHGIKDDRTDMIKRIYDKRGERLVKSGINLQESEFIEIALK